MARAEVDLRAHIHIISLGQFKADELDPKKCKHLVLCTALYHEVVGEFFKEEVIARVEDMHHDRALLAGEGQDVTLPSGMDIVQLEAT
jgi:hypothetical protein